MALVTRQGMVDDDGTFQSGTVVNTAFVNQVYDQIDDQCNSPTNPTQKPKNITDEVVAARGSLGSVGARLDVSLNSDGSLKTGSSAASLTDATPNLVGNDDFLIWPDGDTSVPIYWALTGAGASIARAGTGLGDTKRKIGDFCAKLTRAGTDCYLSQQVLTATGMGRADYSKNYSYISVGAWVWASTATAYITINDGVTNTRSTVHPGDSAWHFLSVTVKVGASATKLEVRCEQITSDGSAYFSGVCAQLMSANNTMTGWSPCPTGVGFIQWEFPGTLANTTDAKRATFHRAGLILDIQAALKTAGTTVNFDLLTNTNSTPTYASVLASTLALGTAKFAGKAVDGATYARRCLRGVFGATPGASSLLSCDVSNVGGTPADGVVNVRILQYLRPFERFNAYNE